MIHNVRKREWHLVLIQVDQLSLSLSHDDPMNSHVMHERTIYRPIYDDETMMRNIGRLVGENKLTLKNSKHHN